MTEVYCLFRDLTGIGEGHDFLGVYTSSEKAKDALPECTWELAMGQWHGKWIHEWKAPTGKVWTTYRHYFVAPHEIDRLPNKESEW